MNEAVSAIKKTYASVIYDSLQDAPWHMERATYCCFLSDLTRFMGPIARDPETAINHDCISRYGYYTI